jgi:hypothetical protein
MNWLCKLTGLNKRLLWALICCVIFAVAIRYAAVTPVQAQSDNYGWAEPILLFSGKGTIYDPTIVADQEGGLHAFWRWVEPDTEATGYELLYYSYWDGVTWSFPIDIVAGKTVNGPSAVVDRMGVIHLIWQGDENRLYYSQALVGEAISAHAWRKPVVIGLSSPHSQIALDDTGKLHVVYPGPNISELYYLASSDGGDTWSLPTNIALMTTGRSLANFARMSIGDDGAIHVVWTEFQSPDAWPPVGLFYARSTDGGITWSEAIELAGGGYNQVNVAVVGDKAVHVVWNGQAGVHGRYHRWSADGGRTWSPTLELKSSRHDGSTGVPPLAVDSSGNLHTLIIDNGCVVHLAWQDEHWTEPVCVSQWASGTSIFTEEQDMTISGGNWIRAIFWDGRHRLWYTARQVDTPDIPPEPFLSTVPIAAPTWSPTLEVTDNITLTRVTFSNDLALEDKSVSPTTPLAWGALLATIFISIVVVSRALLIRSH